MEITVPEQFKTINNKCLKFKGGKIYNQIDSFVWGFISTFIILALYLGICYWLSIKIYGTISNVPKNSPIQFLYPFLFLAVLLLFSVYTGFYNVIDFSKAKISKEFFFFGLWLKIYSNPIEDVIHIGNSVVGEMTNPGGKRGTINGRPVRLNPDTNLFDSYRVNILVKNGRYYSLHFGHFYEDYEDSIKFVAILANYWNVPYIVCAQNYHLVVAESRNGSYVFVDEKTPYCSWTEKIIKILLSFLLIILIIFGTVHAIGQYDKNKRKEQHQSWRPSYGKRTIRY